MQRKVFTGIPGISAAVGTVNRINIFELMITCEILEIVVEQNNLCVQLRFMYHNVL